MAQISAAETGSNNVVAFLEMLAWGEGTSTIKGIDESYNFLLGGKLFGDYSKHLCILVPIPQYDISCTATGRYRLLASTWGAAESKPEEDQLVAMFCTWGGEMAA